MGLARTHLYQLLPAELLIGTRYAEKRYKKTSLGKALKKYISDEIYLIILMITLMTNEMDEQRPKIAANRSCSRHHIVTSKVRFSID